MKIAVRYLDGVPRGGLLKLDCVNLDMRRWEGPPHSEYHEMMLDYSSDSSGSWYLLRLAHTPQTTGSTECNDLIDHASQAMSLSPIQARNWFEKQNLEIPVDLIGDHVVADSVASDEVLPPLTDLQQEVWDLLETKPIGAKDLAKKVYENALKDGAVRKVISRIRKTGRQIENQTGCGYFRLDACSFA